MIQDKKLSDYQKEHFMMAQEVFDDLSYLERLELFNDHPEEYRRLARNSTPPTAKRPTGHNWSSQIRLED